MEENTEEEVVPYNPNKPTSIQQLGFEIDALKHMIKMLSARVSKLEPRHGGKPEPDSQKKKLKKKLEKAMKGAK